MTEWHIGLKLLDFNTLLQLRVNPNEYLESEIDDKLFTWLAQNPDVLSHVPSILSCSPVSAAGAPQLHIRVLFLTSSSAVTSTTNAMYINTASTTAAVPASKTSTIGPTSTMMTTAPITKPSPTSTSHVSSANPPSPVQSPHESNQDITPPAASTPEKSTEAKSQGNTAAASSFTSVALGDTVSPTILPPQTTQNQVSSNQPTVDASKTTAPDSVETNMGKPSDVTTKAAVSQEAGSSEVAPSQNNIPAADTTTQAIRTTDPVMIVIGGATATLLSSVALVIETTILKSGGLAFQTSGTTDLARPSEALTDVETLPVSSSLPSVFIPVPVVVGKVTATPIVSGGFIIESQTIAPGSPAVEISGTTYSIQASQSNVIVNGQTPVASASYYPTIPGVVGSATDRPYSSIVYAIGGQTLSAGGPAIEVSGTTYSLQPSGGNVLLNGQFASVSTIAPQESPSAPVAFGEIKATPVASGVYIVVDQTISRGGSAIQISGTTYSLPPSGSNVEVDGQSTRISTIQAPPASIVIGEFTAKPGSSGAYYLVADQTLSPGGSAIEISGVTYSLPTFGANVVINGATSIMSLTDILTVLTVVLGSATAVPLLAGGYIVGTEVLRPGGSAIEVSGTMYSLPVSGNTVIIDGQPTPVKTFGSDPVITIGFKANFAVAASVTPLIIASQTLVPGGSEITVSGTVFSLPLSATGEVVINGKTASLSAAASAGGVLAFGSQQLIFTPLKSGIVVASQTLYPGGPVITIDGQMLSLPTNGGSVVIKSGTQTTTKNLGNYIWQGIASSTSESISGSSSDSNVSSGSSTPPKSSSHPGITSTTVESPTETEAVISSQTTSSNGGCGSLSASLTGFMLVSTVFVLGLEKRNDAIQVNPNTQNNKHVDIAITVRGSDSYFAICAVMSFVALGVMAASAMKPSADRIFFYITAAINTTACIAYFAMGSNLGWTSIDVAGVNREVFYVRFVTTPLLLMDLLLTAGLTWPTILWTIFLDVVMIVTGLVGALVKSRYKWGFWAFGTVAMFAIFWNLAIGGRKHAKHLGSDIARTYTICGRLTLFIWLCYPICWGVSEGANVNPPDSEAAFYGVLDFLAKPVFSVALITGHWNINPGGMRLKLRDYDEDPDYFGPKNGAEAAKERSNGSSSGVDGGA
ncbi:bacteriorhodopsin [Aureobasidium pullulans]|uniref:Bacteriorhodopsin n=1 Tax=Aureobasidium pullulans TaxID=5580 RepID=A0A4S9L4M0_AURPU|nr:bacteriorhodopsin [Aureobasidium pullulans]